MRRKTQVLKPNVKIYSLVFSILACAWQLQKKSYGRLFADYRLSGNNRPITDYLKNGRLIGFADYLPINRLIPTCLQNKIATVRQNPELYFLKSLAHCRLVVKS
jgi:hypothetical protein